MESNFKRAVLLIEVVTAISRLRYDQFVLKDIPALMSRVCEIHHFRLYNEAHYQAYKSASELWEYFKCEIETVLNANKKGYRFIRINDKSDTVSFDVELPDGDTTKIHISALRKENCYVMLELSCDMKCQKISIDTLKKTIIAVCSPELLKNIEALYDLAVIVSEETFEYIELCDIGTKELVNILVPQNMGVLEQAFIDQSGGNTDITVFYSMIEIVRDFMSPFFSGQFGDMTWDCADGVWKVEVSSIPIKDTDFTNFSSFFFEVTALDISRFVGEEGLLGLEFASGYWGLSTFDHLTLPIYLVHTIYGKENDRIDGGTSEWVLTPREVTLEHTVEIADNIFVTDKERTVCDMIRYGCHSYHLLESVYSFYGYYDVQTGKREDTTVLEETAREYGVLDKLLKLRDEAEEIYSSGDE